MNKRSTKALAMLLVLVMLIGVLAIPASAAKSPSEESSYKEILASLTADSYSEYLLGAKNDGAEKGKTEIKIDIFDYTVSDLADGDSVSVNDAMEVVYLSDLNSAENLASLPKRTEKMLLLPDSGVVTWNLGITAETAGLYGIRIEYLPVAGSTSAIERKIFVNGSVPFDEARAVSLSKVWQYTYEKDENGNDTFRTDAGDNDIRASIAQYPVMRTYECTDIDGFYNEAFQFYFKAGATLSLVGSREDVAIKSITLFPVESSKKLEDYQKIWADKGYTNAPADAVVEFRAETPKYVSDTAVYPGSDRSSAINTPLEAFSQKINVIGSSSYDTTGQWAMYTFTVPADGIYNIVARYKQSALEGMFASRVIKLAGGDVSKGGPEVGNYGYADGTPTAPYEECYYTRFDYSSDWNSEALNTNGDGTELCFYFRAGVTYTLSMEVGLGTMASLLNTIENSLTVINNAYLEIMKLTGADPDEYRDYGFRRLMPHTIEQLGEQAKILEEQAEYLKLICESTGSNIATLENIYRLLYKMYEDEDEIAVNLSNLKSYIGTLGTWINTAKAQSITVDLYQITSPEAEAPKANANFFESVWYEMKSFVASFFVQYDAMGVTEKSEDTKSIEVWLAYGRDQSQIWKNLIINEFSSKDHGIAVDLKLVAGGTLLPSVLAQQGPDAYIGLASAEVINYAIRGAIINIEGKEGFNEVRGYDDFKENVCVKDADGNTFYTTEYYKYTYNEKGEIVDELTQTLSGQEVKFNAATMIPITLYKKTYGLPEQANLPMMFYRLDILAELEIDVPETWDDVLATIPTLQANNMQIGLAYASALTMFLYQFGGNLWRYTDHSEVPEQYLQDKAFLDFYDKYAGAATGLDSNIALESFAYCCRLYTDYSFPTAFDGPNRFRTGEIPLLIADYIATYNQLVVFATEIRGLWAFTDIPGTVDANGVLNNDSVVTVTATVMLKGCKDEESTWTYMQWQALGEVQAQYGNEMVALVGPAAKYATANIEGIKALSWSSTEEKGLLAQFDNLAAVPNYPGSYIISRYTSFAFLAAYNDGADPASAMQDYINIINQEITRKREEFEDLTLKDGQTPLDAWLEPQS